MDFYLVPASKQSTSLYDIYLMMYVQSWIPDYGQKDRPKHVEWFVFHSRTVHPDIIKSFVYPTECTMYILI